MDRYKEGYNDCNRDWEKKIKEILYYNKQNDIDGYNWSSHNIELIVKLEELLKKGEKRCVNIVNRLKKKV